MGHDVKVTPKSKSHSRKSRELSKTKKPDTIIMKGVKFFTKLSQSTKGKLSPDLNKKPPKSTRRIEDESKFKQAHSKTIKHGLSISF